MIPLPSVQELLEKSIFELLQINNIPDEKKQAIAQKMTETIELRVFERLLAELGTDEQTQFQAAVEANNQEVVQAILKKNQPLLQTIISEEIVRYRVELVGLLHTVTNPAEK